MLLNKKRSEFHASFVVSRYSYLSCMVLINTLVVEGFPPDDYNHLALFKVKSFCINQK